ncbi:CoA transferase [Nocardia sp. NPDC004604]|uniref:CoA transferase n=1 Tax=Nocardia sp. NPDC004604 TaxID=3157013 RepID=UPI0033B13DE2
MTLRSAEKLTVLDAGDDLATTVAAALMRRLGATVIRVGQPTRIKESYPYVDSWEPWESTATRDELPMLLRTSDVVLLGGVADPDVAPPWSANDLRSLHPHLVVVEITGWPGDPGFPAVELLVQARSGIASEQHADRAFFYGQQPATYGAALLALCGTWAALLQRRTTGRGQLVGTTLFQGLALIFPSLWMDAERPAPKFDLYQPRGVQQLVFPCADGEWIQLVLGVRGALARLYSALGIDEEVDPNHSGAPNPNGGLRNYYAPYDVIAPAIARHDRAEVARILAAAGVGVEFVNNPGDAWDDEQVRASGILESDGQGGRRVGVPLSVVAASDPIEPSWQASSDEGQPLKGLRVVDFGTFVAGPMSTRILRDLGADVVWVEPVENPRPVTTYRSILVSNRGKRGIRVDLKSEAGLSVVRRLIGRSHVAAHNFRVGVADRLGISPADLRVANPGLVSLQTSGYGQHGPRAAATGFDFIFQSLAGLARRASGPIGMPELCRSNIVDFATAGMGALAVLIALEEQAETGRAMEAEVDLLRTSLFLLADVLEDADGQRHSGIVVDDTQTGFHPWERFWRTADGWIAVAARTEAAGAAVLDELAVSPQANRAAWDAEVVAAVADAVSRRATDDLVTRLDGRGVWSVRVAADGWPIVRTDAGARACGVVTTADDPRYGVVTGWFGTLVNVGAAATPSQASAPTPGQFTEEVLREIGYDGEDIAALIEARAVALDDTNW